MYKFFAFLSALILLSSCTRTIYVVRHAERMKTPSGTMVPNDMPLSEAGKVRAFVLRDELQDKHIRHIYSTNTVRTISTADPLSQAININIKIYNTRDSLDQFIEMVRKMKGNTLIVGHSNTVDDIVNKLCNQTKVAGDLPDSVYDNLYILTQKGKKIDFRMKKYGYPSAPER